MIERKLQKSVIESLQSFPVVGIVGSRQTGKTTLAKSILKEYPNSLYLDLELPSDFNKLQNAELFLNENASKLIIIDEVQRLPILFPVIRALVDQDRRPARFLILGSASPIFIKGASESLAGRIIYHELTPFSIDELSFSSNSDDTSGLTAFQDDQRRSGSQLVNELWLKGGYPLSYLSERPEESFIWRESFIKTYLEQDIPQLGIRIPAIQLRRFWTILAHNHGKLWNSSHTALSLGVSAPTVKNYLDILSDTFIVRQLTPYFTNVKKRIVKAAKTYVRDSGLLHALLGIKSLEQLYGNPIVGFSWEGFIVEQIINITKNNYEHCFYRTGAGAEIDLLLVKNNIPEIAIEIKFSLEPKISKGFWVSLDELRCKKGFVIYPGKDVYPIHEKVAVTSIDKFWELIC
ncbi:ATP-binding protein [Patescibacteria group bacterium]|nr:ATP-binding protein [Patescibacteria group bacterium]